MGWIVKTEKSDPDDGVPIGNLKEEQAGDLFPYVVQWLAGEIGAAYGAAFDLPGE